MESVKDQTPRKEGLQSFFEGKKLWIVLSLLAFFLFLVIPRIFHRAKDKKTVSDIQTGEKRAVFSEKELKELIQASLKEAPQAKPKGILSAPRKRNYGTEIAVFIHEEKEAQVSKTSSRSSSKKIGLPSGTKIKAFLSGTLFSFNVQAPVVAQVSEDFVWKGEVVIPKGSQFLGEAGILKSLNRINVYFDELIFPDGRQFRVHAMALSEDGSAGIKGKVRKHKDLRILKAIGEAAIAGGSLFLGGVNRDPYSYEDQLRMNLAQNLTQEARNDLRNVKVDTSITAESFTPIQIILLSSI